MTSAPLIPPRPSRTKDNEATSSFAAPVPAIPPRPNTKPRSKSPLPTGESSNENSEGPILEEEEPALTTISPSTELYHPVATRSPYKTPVRKDTGIPQIGSRVPMYPNAGDVQAPTPSATPGGGKKAHVYREEWELDEGAYGSYGTPRVNPYTRSSSDLNQSVAQGMTTPETSTPVPDEEIGYLASEQYARVISPDTGPVNSSGEDAASIAWVIDGDLSVDDKDRDIAIHLDPPTHHHHLHNHHPHRVPSSKPGTRPSTRPASPTKHYNDDGDDESGENDTETKHEREHEYPILAEDEVLKRAGGEFMLPAVSPPLTAWRPGSTANSRPQSVHPGGFDDDEGDLDDSDIEPVGLSAHGFQLRESLAKSSLESGERPEPLFPESDDEAEAGTKTLAENKNHEKLKRPGMPESMGSSGGHKFPSKDVWEEAPGFSQLEATVSQPVDTEMTDEEKEVDQDIPERTDGKPETGVTFIHGQPSEHYMPGDEVEFERKQKEALKKTAEYRHKVNREGRDEGLEKLLKRGTSTDDPDNLGLNASRAGTKRFPSNDIWEDVPPSLQLCAEIKNLPEEEYTAIEPKECATTRFEDPATAVVEKRPTTGAPVETSSKPELPVRPAVPSARPLSKARNVPQGAAPTPPEHPQASASTEQPATEKKLPPGLPDRPKPKVPLNRPVRPIGYAAARSPSADAVLTTPKPKPSIPPRTGGKIAALKAGFLSDLDNRLKLGPMAPKKPEEGSPVNPEKEKEKEKEVLADPRKSRAKGPRGRKLPTATATETAKEAQEKKQEFMSVGVWTIWSVGDEGDVEVPTDSPPAEEKGKEPEVAEEAPVATTSTLPGVSGTGVQTVLSVSATADAKETEDVPVTTAAEERGKGGVSPTVAPLEGHPEDAVSAAVQEGVGETEKGRIDEVAEVVAAGGEVNNTEGDVRVEV